MTFYYREYDNYNDYLNHQASKIKKLLKKANKSSHLVRKIYFKNQWKKQVRRIKNIKKYIKQCSKVLCLGARTGAEVVAFNKLGMEAIGIDINPPNWQKKYVIKGDFHNIPFYDKSFEVAFCNCIDHVFDMDKFCQEVTRILKDNGILVLEIDHLLNFEENKDKAVKDSRYIKYESLICDSFDDIRNIFKDYKLIHYSDNTPIKHPLIYSVFQKEKK